MFVHETQNTFIYNHYAWKQPQCPSVGILCYIQTWNAIKELKETHCWSCNSIDRSQRHYALCKEVQPVHPKGDQSWVFIGRTDAKAETPVLWPPDTKSWLIGKDPDAGRDWGQEEKRTTEDEMAGCPSPTRWTWVWVNSGSWWWTGRPGVLRFMG